MEELDFWTTAPNPYLTVEDFMPSVGQSHVGGDTIDTPFVPYF